MAELELGKKKTLGQKLGSDGVQNTTMFAILILLCIITTIIEPSFLSVSNFKNILVQVSSTVIIGSAVTMVLISGNLDLSVGAVGAMAGVMYGVFARGGIETTIAIILAVLIGGIMGAINGSFVALLRLPSFIVTIATMYVARGIAYIGAGGAVINTDLPGDFGALGKSTGVIPLPIVYTIIVFAIFMIYQNKTVIAKEVYAIGANIKAAELSGIRVNRNLIITYIMCGLASAFAGVIITARFAQADCKILTGFEFDAVIAAVLGGTELTGGKGTVFGILMGALILGVLSNLMNMLGFANYYQNLVKGIVLVLAIVLNRYIRSQLDR
ncbi:ABC transporter permease [Chakrabartyella piscis]|uniref:ABC transporter permease n=1 Tax=Chakrabartyella piscis TaxID=2918914 RepID=UPI0029583A30|nr:ABC transporter permease [Chakrabartyella piscis]